MSEQPEKVKPLNKAQRRKAQRRVEKALAGPSVAEQLHRALKVVDDQNAALRIADMKLELYADHMAFHHNGQETCGWERDLLTRMQVAGTIDAATVADESEEGDSNE